MRNQAIKGVDEAAVRAARPVEDWYCVTNRLGRKTADKDMKKCPVVHDAELRVTVQDLVVRRASQGRGDPLLQPPAEQVVFFRVTDAFTPRDEEAESDAEDDVAQQAKADGMAELALSMIGTAADASGALKERAAQLSEPLSEHLVDQLVAALLARIKHDVVERPATDNLDLLSTMTGGSDNTDFVVKSKANLDAQAAFLSQHLGLSPEEAREELQENFKTCVDLAGVLSKRNPRTVDLGRALEGIGLAADGWGSDAGMRFNRANAQYVEGGRVSVGFPLKIHQVNGTYASHPELTALLPSVPPCSRAFYPARERPALLCTR